MSAETIEARLRRVIIDTNGVEPSLLTLDVTFDALGFDELDSVELVIAIEKEFGIEVPDEDFATWTCMRDGLTYIEGRAA